ncbi:MAG TPA: recombinase family protein [Candidatus Saccharimonadales bacterium]|nr:recombinase family protein [Candidatus Saccharimonadales bacterium]
MPRKESIDIRKLRYVLYARKSTEDEARQVRSVGDQIKDCQKLAKDLGLNVVETIKETKSAKRPDQRPLFSKMIKDIEAKKYDAILCWHPDRLCRNMLEGGRIINMLDENTLKDIRFNSHQFSNDANGKMLLGMLFVFSKQYSDDLSDKVNRGISGNLEEGKSAGAPKLGYTRSEVTGYYEPNEFFGVIEEAWRRRLTGESLDAITAYLHEQNVHRVTKNKKKQRILRPGKSTVGYMFSDPFYYGILIQASQTVDLCELTPFKKIVTKEMYEQVQALGYGRTKSHADKKRTTFFPLRGFVYCGVCNSDKYMKVGKNKTGGGTYVLTYRCDNKECTRQVKSFRAKYIFESIYKTLDKFELGDEAYGRYSAKIDGRTDEKIVEIKQAIHSKRGVLSHIKSELSERALAVGRMEKKSPAYQPNMDKLEQLADQQADLEEEIRKLDEKVANPRQIKVGREEFLNLVKTASQRMKAGSAVEKDVLCRILFLNLRVDNEKVASYLWREPFATLVKATEIQDGGGGWT